MFSVPQSLFTLVNSFKRNFIHKNKNFKFSLFFFAETKTKNEKSKCWYVGDDLVDVDSAKACGITMLGVASGRYSKEELSKRGADKVIDDFKDILKLM